MLGLDALREIQGIVASGYGERSVAAFFVFRVVDARRAKAWLKALLDTGEIQFSEYVSSPRHAPPFVRDPAVNVAFTPSGLRKFGLPEAAVRTFSPQFLDGMSEPNRARRLGDDASSQPDHWRWGAPQRDAEGVVMIYAGHEKDPPATRASLGRKRIAEFIAKHCATESGLAEVVPLLETVAFDRSNARREHFGFRDGIQNPIPRDLANKDVDLIDTGEFVLGYKNEAGYPPIGPEVPRDCPGAGALPAGNRPGFSAFGKNGTYLVFRELEQDVAAFWRSIRDQVRDAIGGDPDDEALRAGMERLGAKLMGRWRDGAPVTLYPDASPGPRGDVTFLYDAQDPYGTRCPIGSHVRRTNPRDTLLPVPSDRVLSATSDADTASSYRLEIANIHRIIRRGRPFGEPVTPSFDVLDMANSSERPTWPTSADERDRLPKRGIYFLALCSNIQRQFEFVQTNWALNPTFAGLRSDPDPILGASRACPFAANTFTVQGTPPERYRIERVIETRGGAYLFVPSRSALGVLAGG